MSELLAASMIRIDKAHLTSQFAPRIEHALHELWKHQIIGGKEPAPVEEIDKSRPQWGKAWLASRWIIPPPTEVQEFYARALKPSLPQSLPRGTRKKEQAKDAQNDTPR